MDRELPKYPPELMQRAVAMVAEVRSSFPSESEAVNAVAGVLGIHDPEEIRRWVNWSRVNAEQAARQAATRSLLNRATSHSRAIIISVAVTILGGLGLAYSQQLFGIGQPANVSAPKLVVDQIGLTAQGWHDTGTTETPRPFKIDVKLLNIGNQIAAINSAQLVMQQSVVLPQCAGLSGYNSTGDYPVNLPPDPRPGEIVSVPVSQLVPPNGADRFELLLSTKMTPGRLDSKYLYRFHLYLTYNEKNARLDLGEVIIDYPYPPDEGEYYWSKSLAADPSQFNVLTDGYSAEAKACDIKNSRALRSILSRPGARSGDLAQILPKLSYLHT